MVLGVRNYRVQVWARRQHTMKQGFLVVLIPSGYISMSMCYLQFVYEHFHILLSDHSVSLHYDVQAVENNVK